MGPGLCLGSSSAAQRGPRAPLRSSFVGVKQPSGFLAGNTSQVCRPRLAWTVLEGGRDETGLVRVKEISSFNKNKMSKVFRRWVECTWLIESSEPEDKHHRDFVPVDSVLSAVAVRAGWKRQDAVCGPLTAFPLSSKRAGMQ